MKSPGRPAISRTRAEGGSEFGQDDYLDRVVFQGRRGGTFLELGGFDGVNGSNSLFFEQERAWSGWLLEPDPGLCDQARSNRECVCLQVAIAGSDGRASFWRPTASNRRMMGGLSEMMRPKYLEALRSERTHTEETIEVATISPGSLVQQIGVDTIDYVSLDIEGAERVVLEAFPFEHVSVGAWSIENLEATHDIEQIMQRHGFALVRRLGVDEIYVPHDRADAIRDRADVSGFDEAADLLEAGFFAHSVAAHQALIEATPRDPYAWNNLGLALVGVRDHQLALEAHRRSVDLDPSQSRHRRNLQRVLIELGDHDEALSIGTGTADPSPRDRALIEQSRFELAYRAADTTEALAAASRWKAAVPDADAHARFAEAEALLADGRFIEGWAGYEARREAHFASEQQGPDGVPEWRGESLDGKRLLVLGEQGLGDQVFFSRFVPSVVDRVAETTVAVPAPLRRLFESTGETVTDLPDSPDEFDAYVRMGSIPHLIDEHRIVGPRRFDLPLDAIARAQHLLGPRSDGVRRAGVVWSGQTGTTHQRARHLSLDTLRPVFEIPDVRWYSPAKGPMTADITTCGLEDHIVDVGSSDRDLADAAAVCVELDFVVTVCTVTAHLAASLGVPTIVLVHHRPFWVWGHDGDTTPWYPSARILRQPEPGDWAAVVDALTEVIAYGSPA